MKKRFIALALISALGITACSSSEDAQRDLVANQGANALYQQAKKNMEIGNFSAAAQTLSAIDAQYPFGELSDQVQLDLIYSYYKSGDNEQALATIDRFVRLNPNHSDVDYAMFMRGLTNMGREKNFLQSFFNIDRADRDPAATKEAFEDFRRLLERHPESKYAADAKQRMVAIKDRLARYEIAVAKFYMRREAWVAAANRGRHIIEYYGDTAHTQQALEIMVESYEKIGLEQLRQNSLATLRLNYPQSDLVQ
ncbi:MAG: outer membrane protein assembly factor BamD [Pseudomonadota bacterium]